MLADLAGLSALPQPVPIRQLRVRAGTCPGKATGPGGSEDSAATPLLAHPRWGVKAQGGAHPRVAPAGSVSSLLLTPSLQQTGDPWRTQGHSRD